MVPAGHSRSLGSVQAECLRNIGDVLTAPVRAAPK
jgi:hypothetical protein